MAQKFEEASNRVFKDIYICRKCNARIKTDNPENTSCRKCGYNSLRYEGEIKREKTKTIDQGMPEIGAELDLLDTVEQVLSSDKDEGVYKQLIELYNGENTVGEVEQELNSNGYSIVDAREATRLLEEEQVLEIEEPGVYKTNSQAESLYQVLDAL